MILRIVHLRKCRSSGQGEVFREACKSILGRRRELTQWGLKFHWQWPEYIWEKPSFTVFWKAQGATDTQIIHQRCRSPSNVAASDAAYRDTIVGERYKDVVTKAIKESEALRKLQQKIAQEELEQAANTERD
jgi:hypothetical protein